MPKNKHVEVVAADVNQNLKELLEGMKSEFLDDVLKSLQSKESSSLESSDSKSNNNNNNKDVSNMMCGLNMMRASCDDGNAKGYYEGHLGDSVKLTVTPKSIKFEGIETVITQLLAFIDDYMPESFMKALPKFTGHRVLLARRKKGDNPSDRSRAPQLCVWDYMNDTDASSLPWKTISVGDDLTYNSKEPDVLLAAATLVSKAVFAANKTVYLIWGLEIGDVIFEEEGGNKNTLEINLTEALSKHSSSSKLESVTSIAMSPNGDHVFALVTIVTTIDAKQNEEKVVMIFDVSDVKKKPKASIPLCVDNNARAIVLSPWGTRFVVVMPDKLQPFSKTGLLGSWEPDREWDLEIKDEGDQTKVAEHVYFRDDGLVLYVCDSKPFRWLCAVTGTLLNPNQKEGDRKKEDEEIGHWPGSMSAVMRGQEHPHQRILCDGNRVLIRKDKKLAVYRDGNVHPYEADKSFFSKSWSDETNNGQNSRTEEWRLNIACADLWYVTYDEGGSKRQVLEVTMNLSMLVKFFATLISPKKFGQVAPQGNIVGTLRLEWGAGDKGVFEKSESFNEISCMISQDLKQILTTHGLPDDFAERVDNFPEPNRRKTEAKLTLKALRGNERNAVESLKKICREYLTQKVGVTTDGAVDTMTEHVLSIFREVKGDVNFLFHSGESAHSQEAYEHAITLIDNRTNDQFSKTDGRNLRDGTALKAKMLAILKG